MSFFENWDITRRVSFVGHLIYLLATVATGIVCACLVWYELFQSFWAPLIGVTLVETLSAVSLVMYILHIPWPLVSFRHALPYLSVFPIGYELAKALENHNDPYTSYVVAACITAWFMFLTHKFLLSMENLFVDPVYAAREKARGEMQRLSTSLAKYQETRLAAETFAKSVIPSTTPTTYPLLPVPDAQDFIIHQDADPRFLNIANLALERNDSGGWLFSPEQIATTTRADKGLVEVTCKMVRSGQVTIGTKG